jgi:phosphatidylglycerol---prolipoprotein diacylglyceryl transferase
MIGLAAVLYAPARFLLDFLRATDVARPDQRYAALTPAQWACLATFALGIYLFTRPGATEPVATEPIATDPVAADPGTTEPRPQPEQ